MYYILMIAMGTVPAPSYLVSQDRVEFSETDQRRIEYNVKRTEFEGEKIVLTSPGFYDTIELCKEQRSVIRMQMWDQEFYDPDSFTTICMKRVSK